MKTSNTSKSGYALVTVVGIMAVMAIAFSSLMLMGKQSVFSGKIWIERTKATAYAEAGIEFAYALIRDDFDKRNDPSAFWTDTNSAYTAGADLSTQYEDGNFTLGLTPMGDGQYVIVNSIGTCGKSSVEVEVMVEDYNFKNQTAWEMAIYAGGNGESKVAGGGYVDSDGNLQTIHFNGNIALNGGADVEANVSTTQGISGNNDITGDKTENAPYVSPPKLEDNYSSFADYSTSAGTIYDADFTVGKSGYTASGKNTIVYVDGSVTIKGPFIGTIICTEDIVIQAGGSITAGDEGIAVATQYGSIEYKTTATSTGLFYADSGNFLQQASNGNLIGQIIVGGTVQKTGGSGITFTGGDSDDAAAYPVLAGWQK